MGNEVVLRFLADTGQLDAAFSKLVAKSAATQSTLQRIGAAGAGMTKAGRSITHGITLPILAAGGAAGVLGYKWDQTWTRMAALTNLTSAEIDKAKAKVLDLSRYGTAPQKLADGFYFLASSGLSADKALDALDASSKGATVGLGNYNELAMTVSASMNVWKDRHLSAATAVDVMIAAVKAGTMEPAKMATNLGKVAGQAAAVGMTMHETAGAMAAMTNAGLAVEASAVGLGQIINHISKPTKAASKEADKLGLSFDGLTKTIRQKGLMAALTEMDKKTGGNDKSIRTLLANQQAIRAYYALMKNGGTDTADVMRQMAGAAGGLNRALAETAESPAHKIDMALSRLQAQATKWGELLLPRVADLAMHLTKLMEQFNKLTPEQQQQVLKWAAIAAAIGPVLYVMGKLTSAFATVGRNWKSGGWVLMLAMLGKLYTENANFRDSINDLAVKLAGVAEFVARNIEVFAGFATVIYTARAASAAFATTQAVIGTVLPLVSRAIGTYRLQMKLAAMEGKTATVVTKAWAAAQVIFNMIMAANPIGLAVVAIGLLVAAFIYAWKHSETFRNKMKDAWDLIKKVTGDAVAFIIKLIKGWANVVMTQFQIIIEGAALLFGWVPGIGPKLKEAADKFSEFKTAVNDKFDEIANAANGWGEATSYEYVNGLRTSSPGLIAASAQASQKVKDAWKDPNKYWREAGKQDVTNYTNGLRAAAAQAQKQAAANARKTAEAARVTGKQFMRSVGDFTGQQYTVGVGSAAPLAKSAGIRVANSARAGMDLPADRWTNLGWDAASGYANGIMSGVDRIAAAGRAAAYAAETAIKKTQKSNSPSKVMYGLGKDAGDGYRLGISASQAGVTSAASAMTKKLIDQVKKAQTKVKSEEKDVWDAMHPGKGRKVNQTTVRHQKEQLAAAKKNLDALQKQLAASRKADAELQKRRRAGLPMLGTAEQLLAPFRSMGASSQGPITRAANQMAANLQKQFADKSGALPTAVRAIKDQLITLAKEAADLHQSVFDALAGGSSVVSKFSGMDATSGDMRAFLDQRVRDITALGSGLEALAKRGLPPSLLKDLAMGGVDALPLVRSLMSAGAADFAAIVSAQRRVDALSNSTASQIEGAVYRGAQRGMAGQRVSGGASVTIQTLNVTSATGKPKDTAEAIRDELLGLGG